MSIFSSLNYLLTRAASAINQTESSQDVLHQDNPSLDVTRENSTINTTRLNQCHHLLSDAFTCYISGEIHNLFVLTEQNSTLSSEAQFAAESTASIKHENPFANETYPNAEHLLESWWNIFDSRYLRHGWGLTVTMIMVYMIILVAGVIGNVMVILVVLLRPKMRSVTNLFILNLAIADFFVIVFCVPSTLLSNIFAPWILGTFMCKAVAYVQGVSVCAAAYSLVAISLDRCQAICRNYERPRGFFRRTCAITVLMIWLAAISLNIPWAVIFEVKVSEYDGLRYCMETWENENLGNIYFLLVNLVCFYAIPFLLIFFSNLIIYFHVANRPAPQNSASSASIKTMHRDTRRHVLKMLAIVTLTFLISWLPAYILVLIIKYSDNITELEYKVLGIIMPIAQWLGTWNSSINPILYAFLNKMFRKMFKSILPPWIRVKSTSSARRPTFTTGFTGKSSRKSNSSDKTDSHQSKRVNSQNHTNILITKPHELNSTLQYKLYHVKYLLFRMLKPVEQ